MESKTLPIGFFLLTFFAVLRSNSSDCIKRKYIIVDKQVTFDEAVQLCLQYGMEIASPLSAEEDIILKNLLKAKAINLKNVGILRSEIWIGARRALRPSSEFYWVNTGKPLLFSNFLPGQPDYYNRAEHCIQLRNEYDSLYGWNDLPCETNLRFACQTRMVIEFEKCG